jgi:4-amino-4-deoxy-L-arabinose transferase-like glycosyltransferase
MSTKQNASKRAGTRRDLYAIILLAATLRLLGLGHQSIWGDEFLTLFRYSAGNSLGQVWTHVWHFAVHPPVYFIICHYWYLLGQSEFMARFPSAVFGIACIPVMYALANRLFGRTSARITAIIAATSPIHIWYSQEARMYTLQVLLAATACLFFVRAWQNRRTADVVLYAAASILGLYTQMSTLLLVFGIGVFAVLQSMRDRRHAAMWFAVHALILIAYTPWLMNIHHAREADRKAVTIGYERPKSIADLGYGFYTFSVGFSFGPTVADLHGASEGSAIKKSLPQIAISGLLFSMLAIFGTILGFRKQRPEMIFTLTILLLPSILAAAASLTPAIPLNPRYMLVAIVPYWMLLALGIEFAASFEKARLAIPAFAILIGVSLFNHYFDERYAKQDLRAATAVVNKDARPGDTIIISSIELGGPFIYYYRRQDIPFCGYPKSVGLVDPTSLKTDMCRLLTHKRRAWLVLGRTWSSDPDGLLPSYFDSRFAVFEKTHCNGVSVIGYSLPINGK